MAAVRIDEEDFAFPRHLGTLVFWLPSVSIQIQIMLSILHAEQAKVEKRHTVVKLARRFFWFCTYFSNANTVLFGDTIVARGRFMCFRR